jgi:hypothetical protein
MKQANKAHNASSINWWFPHATKAAVGGSFRCGYSTNTLVMKHHFSSSFWLYLVSGMLLLTACRKESIRPPLLLGTWTWSMDSSAGGRFVYQLTFTADHTFVWKVSSYGSYPGQGTTDLSALSEFRGKVVQQENILVFMPEETTWWDKFYPGMESKTEKTTQRLFDD